jgi:hypothetical protein
MGSRAVFSNAFGRGLSVAEFRPGNPKAREEVACLMQALYGD